MKWTLSAVLALTFLTSCAAPHTERLRRASEARGELEATRTLPPHPEDCSRLERSGVRVGDRLDTALRKADAAIARGNARVQRCAGWYGDLRAGFSGREGP